MLKRLASPYGVGRKRGDWWKWKIDPYTIDAVLIYAQPGSGKRASLLTDYTFGRLGRRRARAGRQGVLGPDRTRRSPSSIAGSAATRVSASGRSGMSSRSMCSSWGSKRLLLRPATKSGVAVRFPRMLRWRKDKPAAEADTLETLKALIATDT